MGDGAERGVQVVGALIVLVVTIVVPASPFSPDATLVGPQLVEASARGSDVTLRFDRTLAPETRVDPDEIVVTLNGVRSPPPIGATVHAAEHTIVLHLARGAGSADELRLAFPGGSSAIRDAIAGVALGPIAPIDVPVHTPAFTLPDARRDPAGAVVGDAFYAFGGWIPDTTPSREVDTIVRVDLRTGDVRTLDATLPAPSHGAGAATDPAGVIWLFGGATTHENEVGAGRTLDTIVRFDAASGEVRLAQARLPTPRAYVGAVWADGVVVLVGGRDAQRPFAEILRYDPAADQIEPSRAQLVEAVGGPGVAWDPRTTPKCPAGCVYALGGWKGGAEFSRLVSRYDPVLDVAAPAIALLPDPVQGPAVWLGDAVWLVGGSHFDSFITGSRSVQRFDPAIEQATQARPLPVARLWHTAGANAGELVLLGGSPAGPVERVRAE